MTPGAAGVFIHFSLWVLGCVYVCVCACRPVFTTLVMFSLYVLQNKHSASRHHYFLSLVVIHYTCFMQCLCTIHHVRISSGSLYANTEDTEEGKLVL